MPYIIVIAVYVLGNLAAQSSVRTLLHLPFSISIVIYYSLPPEVAGVSG